MLYLGYITFAEQKGWSPLLVASFLPPRPRCSWQRAGVVAACGATLVLTGCSTARDDKSGGAIPAVDTVTTTATLTTLADSGSPSAAASGAKTSPSAEDHQNAGSAAPSPTPAPLHLDFAAQPGSTTTIAGTEAIICVNGDGFGLNVVAAGPNTSCDFSVATLNTLTAGLNATYDNVRSTLPRALIATSPVTGQDYWMHCSQTDFPLITCTGGQDATVFMY